MSMVASSARRFGDLDLAEEAAADEARPAPTDLHLLPPALAMENRVSLTLRMVGDQLR